jgi:hypothetical protein
MDERKRKTPRAKLHSLRLHEIDTPIGKTTVEETIVSDDSGAVTMRLDFGDLAELLTQALGEAERKLESGNEGG